MTEGQCSPSTYDEARAAVLEAIRELAGVLEADLKQPHKYRMVSQAQARPGVQDFFLWVQSGRRGPQSFHELGSIRAAIYGQAMAARQLEAFIAVSRVVLLELCQTATRGFEAKEISIPLMMLRSMVERIAHIAVLAGSVKGLIQASPPLSEPNKPLLELGDTIAKALMGTKVDWTSLKNANFRTADKEQIAYVQKQLTVDLSARSVLTSIDKLDKRLPGLRVSYDILCEFLHPNIGDLISATIRASAKLDHFGTRHVLREVGTGPKDLSTNPDVESIVSRILLICCDAINLLPLLLGELQEISLIASKMAQSFAHETIRKNHRDLFRDGDLCPCQSGLKVRDCP